jgi:RNA polymerase sigma-70 factor, ECF subfamily
VDRDPAHRGGLTTLAASSAAASAASAALSSLLAGQRRRVVAHVARSLGLAHLALAEDAVQTATLRALEHWPRSGVPDNPAGWLLRVAQHAAIDALRRSRHETPWDDALPEDDAPAAVASVPPAESRFAGELDDDELALLFAACHPALPVASQVALALRALAGLPLEDIAEGLLTNPSALAQRLARARETLAGQTLALPAGDAELAPRRDAVLTALAVMFQAGLRASGRAGSGEAGADARQRALMLCWEAVRLARAVAAHRCTAHGDADALAAMLLLHGARLSGRIDDAGEIVPLAGQPRDRWDAGMVALGYRHLQRAQRAARLSRWHLQAGIAAEHARATSYAATDWAAIVAYYEMLLQVEPSAVPRLGHAIALAEAGEPARALTLLQALASDTPAALAAHSRAATARAHERLGDSAAAVHELEAAIAAAAHPAEARLLARRLAAMRAGA